VTAKLVGTATYWPLLIASIAKKKKRNPALDPSRRGFAPTEITWEEV